MIETDRERLADRLSNRISGNEELRLLAYGELCRRIGRADPVPEAVVLANDHLSSAEANRANRRRKIETFQVLGILLVLVSVGGLIWRWGRTYEAIGEINNPDGPILMNLPTAGWSLVSAQNPGGGPVGVRLAPGDRTFLLGTSLELSENRYPPPEQGDALGLWRRALEKTSQLPPKVLPFFTNLPEDAQCELLAAGLLAPLATKEEYTWDPVKRTNQNNLETARIEYYRLARRFMHSAAARDTSTDESTGLNRRVHSLLPPRKDCLTEVVRVNAAALAGVQGTNGSNLHRMVGTEAREAVREQDVSRFRSLLEDWRAINRHLSGHQESCTYLETTCNSLLRAAAELGVAGETEDVAAIQQRLRAAKDNRSQTARWRDEWQRRGCLFELGPFVENTFALPPIPRADFLPMRNAHHAFVMSHLSFAAAGVFLTSSLLFGAHRFWHGRQARMISHRLPELLRASDAAWIAALGLALPQVWFLFVTLVSPFSVRSESQDQGAMVLQCLHQQVATATLMLLSSILAARWRIHRRCAVTGIPRPALVPGLFCALLTAGAVPAFGLFSYPDLVRFDFLGLLPHADWIKDHHDSETLEFFILSGGTLLFPAWIWLAVAGIRALLGSREKSLARLTLSRVMVNCCAAAILVNCSLIPVWHTVERHWVAKDTLFDIVPESGMPRIGHEITEARRKAFRSLLTGRPE